jgi:hypothetical protein
MDLVPSQDSRLAFSHGHRHSRQYFQTLLRPARVAQTVPGPGQQAEARQGVRLVRPVLLWIQNECTLSLASSNFSLLFMVIDYLKRKGMMASVNQLISESRIDPASSDTIEMVALMESIAQMHGKTPQPSTDAGFLRDWFGAFWSVFQTRLPRGKPMARVDENTIRRTVIMNAMQSVGLGGRDPSTLAPEEHVWIFSNS